ncbi:Putrescine--pyruvate aminotransferase [subsurface metagenome]
MKTKGHVLPRDFKTDMLTAVRGEGIYIYDDTGKRYLDGCSGALISSIGHCIPQVTEAINQQLQKLNFAHPSRWRNLATEEAARALAEITPGDLNYIWFVSGGSEAVESAIKLARQYFIERDGITSARHLIIGRWNSYHGATLGTMAVGGNMARRRIFSPMFKEHPKISPHYCYRCPHGLEYPGCKLRCAHELEDLIQREGADNIAAFIAEPIVGSSVGALVPPNEYWPLIREICNRYDVLLIADEIMTGIGRTGKAFCVDHWRVVPDIIVSAKGMAAGYIPTGGIFVKEVIAETIEKGSGHFQHGYTYNANPVSAAAVTAVLGYIKKNNLIENARIQGELLGKEMARLKAVPIVGEVRGKGLMRGIEIVADKETKKPFPRSLGASGVVSAECTKRGLMVYPGGGMVNGVEGDNLLVAPPLIVKEDQVKEIAGILEQALNAASNILLKAAAS